MKKEEKEIAKLTVNAAEEMCKTLEGFDKLNETSKAIAITFASVAILNKAFSEVIKFFK